MMRCIVDKHILTSDETPDKLSADGDMLIRKKISHTTLIEGARIFHRHEPELDDDIWSELMVLCRAVRRRG